MSGQFFQELAKLDQGIADRWKRVTNGNIKFIISEGPAVTIFDPVLNFSGNRDPKTHKITKGQADAVVKLLDAAKFSPGVRMMLADYAFEAVQLGYFARGASSPLDITVVQTALRHPGVGAIRFVSPGSGLTYTPIDYERVLDLITRKNPEVAVKEVHAAGLNTCSRCSEKGNDLMGAYRGDINEFLIYKGMPPNERTVFIVHEATHVIQDWSDRSMSHFHAEADAYIAGGVVALAISKDWFKKANRYGEVLENATSIAARGEGTANNTAWKQSYEELVNAVGQDALYKEKNGVRFVPDEPKRTQGSEAAEWQTILDKLSAAAALQMGGVGGAGR